MMIGFSRVKNGSAVTTSVRRSVQPSDVESSCGNQVAVNLAFWKKPLREPAGISDCFRSGSEVIEYPAPDGTLVGSGMGGPNGSEPSRITGCPVGSTAAG